MNLEKIIPKSLDKVKEQLKQVTEIAAIYYAESDSAHDFGHAMRVTRLAMRLGQKEGGDLELLALAGFLHDIGRREQELTGICHAVKGAEMAGEILSKLNYPQDKIEQVQYIIRVHRFRDKVTIPTSLEGKILFDADKLDAIGAIGIARAYAISGRWNQALYTEEGEWGLEEDDKNYSPVVEFNFKLKKILHRLLTNSGKEYALQRHKFMEEFFDQLKGEVEGEL